MQTDPPTTPPGLEPQPGNLPVPQPAAEPVAAGRRASRSRRSRHRKRRPRLPVGRSRTWPKRRLLPFALASAALLWLCYFPANLGWLLGWVALVPLLVLVRTDARPRHVYLMAWVAGLAFFWPVLQWMRVADPRMYATWAMLATYCSLYVPAAVALLRWLDRRSRWPLTVTLPLVWTALEYARAHLLTGFAWYFLGHTQHAVLPWIQVADLAGAYAVTFLVAAVNGLVFELLWPRLAPRWFPPEQPGGRSTAENIGKPAAQPPPGTSACHGQRSRRSRRPSLRAQAVGVLLLAAGIGGYGILRLSQEAFEPGPRVALLQGNLDQRLRNAATAPDAAEATVRKMVSHYTELCAQAAEQKPDLIVWPETSFPFEWRELTAGRPDADGVDLGQRLRRTWGCNVLLGMNARIGPEGESVRYNSAVLLRADGSYGGRYDKIHRVPFGEYVPLRNELPFMDRFAPYDFDYSIQAGNDYTRFTLGRHRFGVLICYEDTDPVLARQYVAPGGGPVSFLVNISNDGWFDGTSEHEEHLAICRLRAVESRRSVVRAVNMGISAVIDGSGRVVALPAATWAASKKMEAVLIAEVPVDRRGSFYAVAGDWLPLGCWAGIVIGLLPRFRPKRTLA